MLTAEVRHCLERRGGLNAVAAVGSALRGDDGVGPYIAGRLAGSNSLAVFDAGTNPENIVDEIIGLNPAYLLIVDAADFGGYPGQARVIEKDELPDSALSTHMFPLRAVWEIIVQSIPVEIHLIGIQPSDCGYHEGLSDGVRRTADEIVEAIAFFISTTES